MPEVFRQRPVPEALSEVYAIGMTAETWARDSRRDRNPGDNHAARVMVATLRRLDARLMTDRERGPRNKVLPARLVRKGYGPARSRYVQCRSDWPKSKAARKLDLRLVEDGTIAEEEIRKTRMRDAGQ